MMKMPIFTLFLKVIRLYLELLIIYLYYYSRKYFANPKNNYFKGRHVNLTNVLSGTVGVRTICS